MIEFKKGLCSKCGKQAELMISNNPLIPQGICFHCISLSLKYNNLEHAEFFCRTYNLPWLPETWISLTEEYEDETFEVYTRAVLQDPEYKNNLYYTSSTSDLWKRTNAEWEKCRSFTEILNRISVIRDSYIDRGRLKWGEQYTFNELIKLDSIYSRTLRANNITNPLQKEAVKTLCRLQIQMEDAIRQGDSGAIKNFSSAWANFAKQADLETMINETKTDEITTVAELYKYFEDRGFKPEYYKGEEKDQVDVALKDIKDTLRRTVLESITLDSTLADMIKKRQASLEEQHTTDITAKQSLEEVLNFSADAITDALPEGEKERDTDIESIDFSDEESLELGKIPIIKTKS